jgi:MFS superfamily sulfate permease-like transporter
MSEPRASRAAVAGGGDKAPGAGVRPWPVLRGLAGLRLDDVPIDILAGLTLAAVAIPEQIATAKLAGVPPQAGFFAFIAGTLAFALLGSSRRLSSGADSTIATIFAGALAAVAAAGSPTYAVLAAGLAILTGLIVLLAGLFRMGWIGSLLSIPVTTGFLAGIAVHIVVSQAPAVLGVAPPGGPFLDRILALVALAPRANLACVAIAGGVLTVIAVAHRVSARIPAPLVAVALAAAAAAALHLERRGVAPLGAVNGVLLSPFRPALGAADLLRLTPLALLLALMVMVQTAATTRSFPSSDEPPDIDRDFVGVGAGSLVAGVMMAFPVNASPPRTAIVAESGARTQLAGLVAAAIMMAVLIWAGGLLGSIPQAALAGVLLFVAARLVRVGQIIAILRASPREFLLVLATAAGIIVLPIESGVAAGVGLSLLNGLWASARVRVEPLRPIAGSTVWWPVRAGKDPGPAPDAAVAVLAFAAPLTFLNAEPFAREFIDAVGPGRSAVRVAILEAAGMVEIDYTGAQALTRVVKTCREAGLAFGLARLESLAAQAAFGRLGLRDLIGEEHIFESVAEAVTALSHRLR